MYTDEDIARWNESLEATAASMAAAGDNSLLRFKSFNRNCALAGTYLHELLDGTPDVDAVVEAWCRAHMFWRDFDRLLTTAAEYAAQYRKAIA